MDEVHFLLEQSLIKKHQRLTMARHEPGFSNAKKGAMYCKLLKHANKDIMLGLLCCESHGTTIYLCKYTFEVKAYEMEIYLIFITSGWNLLLIVSRHTLLFYARVYIRSRNDNFMAFSFD